MNDTKKVYIEDIEESIKNNTFVLLYFSSESCDVCKVLFNKVEHILMKYEKIKLIKIDIDSNPKIASKYTVYTIPTILLYIEAKENIREARYISILDLEDKIDRYYSLLN